MLIVIDSYSKYLWIKPLKNKTAKIVASNFEDILTSSKRIPTNLQTDDGLEYKNSIFSALMKRYGINHYSTYSVKKAAMAERVIRTIKQKLFQQFSLHGNYRWINIIDNIVNEYNNTVHSTINVKPNTVNEHTKLDVFRDLKLFDKNIKFNIGDTVRISKHKSLFEKGYLPNWSTELFKVTKIKYTNPVSYLLEDMHGQAIHGSFYNQEMLRAKYPDVYLIEKILRRKNNRIYVKWLGIPEKSWVDQKDVIFKHR